MEQDIMNIASNLPPADRLRVAAALVGRVKGLLTTATATCEECGCTVYDDFAEANAAKALDGAIGRIERTANVLDTLAKEREVQP